MIELTLQHEQQDIYRLITQADDAIETLRRISDQPTTNELDMIRLEHLIGLLWSLRIDLEGVL
jgi:hypothetical protein